MSRWIGSGCQILVLLIGLLGPCSNAFASEVEGEKSWRNAIAEWWNKEEPADLGFEAVFPKPFYKKSYLPWVILATSVVVAGTISYFTAGAGAPGAATGVSVVASAVGGGGAGSYMAGLSVIGGWFGGNAMLGAAILNGISLGVGGGTASWASLSALGKAGVVASVSASVLDGVLFFTPEGNKALTYQVRLAVPDRLGSPEIRELAKELNKSQAAALTAAEKKDEQAWATALKNREELLAKAREMARAALATDDTPAEDRIVLAVLAKDANDSRLAERLLSAIPAESVGDSGYVDYLKAVFSFERGDLQAAKSWLWKSWQKNPYAIEAPILLVNLRGNEGFTNNESEVLVIYDRVKSRFDNDKYDTGYSLLALNYRLATMYYNSKRYVEAQRYYEEAYDEIPWTQKYIGTYKVAQLVQMGIANSLYGQGKLEQANELIAEMLDDAETDADRASIKTQYAGSL